MYFLGLCWYLVSVLPNFNSKYNVRIVPRVVTLFFLLLFHSLSEVSLSHPEVSKWSARAGLPGSLKVYVSTVGPRCVLWFLHVFTIQAALSSRSQHPDTWGDPACHQVHRVLIPLHSSEGTVVWRWPWNEKEESSVTCRSICVYFWAGQQFYTSL